MTSGEIAKRLKLIQLEALTNKKNIYDAIDELINELQVEKGEQDGN